MTKSFKKILSLSFFFSFFEVSPSAFLKFSWPVSKRKIISFFEITTFLSAVFFSYSQSEAQVCPSWAIVGSAVAGPGSAVTLTQAVAGEAGACWNTTPLDLTQNFTMNFSLNFGAKNGPAGNGADGICFVLQNDPRGFSAISADQGG